MERKPGRQDAERIIHALRQGTVPQRGLEHFAVGLDAPMAALRENLEHCAKGNGAYKFIRGPYGSGKTFLASLVGSEAFDRRFLVSKVVVSKNETPLYRPLSVYRRLCQNLLYAGQEGGMPSLIHQWLNDLENQVVELEAIDEDSPDFVEAVGRRVETQLAGVAERSGRLAHALRAYHRLRFQGEFAPAGHVLDWLSGDPHVSAKAKDAAGVRGDLQADDVLPFLRGLLEVIRFRNRGLVLIIDETETQLRLRKDLRTNSWEALRSWVDALDANLLPGLLMLVTGTPELFDSAEGIRELKPLHQRIYVDFEGQSGVNYLQAQIPLPPFGRERLLEVGARIRELYLLLAQHPEQVTGRVTPAYLSELVGQFEAQFPGQLSVTPRLFLRKLVDVLDRADRSESFDPARDGGLTRSWLEELLNEEEKVSLRD